MVYIRESRPNKHKMLDKSPLPTGMSPVISLQPLRIRPVAGLDVVHKVKAIKILAVGTFLLGVLLFGVYSIVESLRREAGGPSYGYIFDDWPNGGDSNKDHWRGGIFFGAKADKIRWIAKPERDSVDVHSIRFFARIPMSDEEFNELVAKLQSSEKYSYRPRQAFDSSRLFFIPDWFPRSEEVQFVCTARDESSWPVLIVRGRGDYTYMHLN